MRTINIYIYSLLICSLSLFGFSAQAQKSSARATVLPSEIMIGEQAVVNLEITAPKGRNIILPIYPDTLIKGIEVLKALPPDTTIAHEVMTISQKYIVTSFDSALYHIPYMVVIDGNDTIKTLDFGLKVTSPQLTEATLDYLSKLNKQETDSIDFEVLGISDIKDVLDPPFMWQDYLDYILAALLFLVLLIIIGLGIYFALRKKNKGYFFKPKVILPPHIIALNSLDKIKLEKLWQQGLEKEFYTELTDTLREYIERRFMLNAFEKTSDEILEAIKNHIETESSLDSLQQILKLSDLVKFAKYKPLSNENDLSIVNAYLFVNQTKIETVTEEDKNSASKTNSANSIADPHQASELQDKEEDKANS